MNSERFLPLVEKYRPKRFSEIKGQDEAIRQLHLFFKTFPKKKAIILTGPAGVGKTSLAIALANEYNLELFELNASDLRNSASLEAILKPSLEQKSLFKKGKIILMDEAEGITSSDRGGLPELLALIEKTPYPIIITCNDIWDKKFSTLRQKAQLISLKKLSEKVIKDILFEVLRKENKRIPLEIINLIAKQSEGDARSALNDLQSVIDLGQDIKEISKRDKEKDIFNVLREIFQEPPSLKTIELFDKLDMQLDEIMLWIEENIPLEYHGEPLAKAFDYLSKADIFRGRIYRQQYWRFLVYQNFFLSYAIASAEKHKKKRFTKYRRYSRILKIWMSNQKNEKKNSLISKYSKFCHMSKKKGQKEFPFMLLILDPENETLKRKLDLNDKEISFLQEQKHQFIHKLQSQTKKI